MEQGLNWRKGLSRIENIAALTLTILNFIYAIEHGPVWGFQRLVGGQFIQKQAALLLAKIEHGKLPDLLFIAIHSCIVFAVARIVFYLIKKTIIWGVAGFKSRA